MTGSDRRVVLTGLGIESPIGQGIDAYWDSLMEQRSGIKPITLFDASGLPVQIAGTVPDFKANPFVEKQFRRNLRIMARTIQFAVVAAQLALDQGEVDKTTLDPTRFGVEFGAGLIATELSELGDASKLTATKDTPEVDFHKWGDEGLEIITPLWMLKYLPNMLACQVSILHNAQGPNNSITESDVASLLALGEAYRILQRDDADFFLVGGAESKINPLSLVRQCLFEPISQSHENPETVCRPFDLKRDGLVLGEGGAVLVVEDLEHAKKRGAKEIYAEIVGFGASFDREKDGTGIARAIRAALADAGITAGDVDHVNAHGLSTSTSDVWEAKGIAEVFGSLDRMVPVFAPKSYFGNLGAGGGIMELSASILALHKGVVPCTLNYEHPDPDCPINVLAREPRSVNKPNVVKIGFTQMGQCAAVVIRRFEG